MINKREFGACLETSPISLTILASKYFLTNNYKKSERLWGMGTNLGVKFMLENFHWEKEKEDLELGLAEESDQAEDL